jgi:CheY-like chemotaxis protein
MAKKILIVDDNPDFVEITRLVLEKAGYEVAAAEDGATCLKKARTEAPDLIFLDVIMATELEGFRVSYELRTTRETAHIPVVMLSGVYNQHPDLPNPQECGLQVAAFLDKPVQPERLLQTIREHLSK